MTNKPKEEILKLWKEYKRSKWARENLNIPRGWPVFNATSFFEWLETRSVVDIKTKGKYTTATEAKHGKKNNK